MVHIEIRKKFRLYSQIEFLKRNLGASSGDGY